MNTETIRLNAVESVRLTREPATIKLELLLGGSPVLSRHLSPDVARSLGDALGFASNDLRTHTV